MALEDHIKRRAKLAADWMLHASFPLWAQAGVHPAGGFEERLDLSGQPSHDATSRVRVQARQVFCFALAKRLGWQPERCDALMDRGIDVLAQQCRRADGLYGKQVRLGEGLVDDRADLYDTSFALLAYASAAGAERSGAQALASDLSSTIDEVLARPGPGAGYQEAVPCLGMRLQNPHMHLFEASLAQYRITGTTDAAARTRAIAAFIEAQFFDPATGTLREVTQLNGSAHSDDRLEAGHHYEWVWLLHHYAATTGDALPAMARALYKTALALTPENGRIPLAHNRDGTVQITYGRTWGQTEALRAHIAAYHHGWASPRAIIDTFDLLWADHILPAPMGAWIDRVDHTGSRLADDITAASGYHLFGAFEELMQLAKAL